MKTLNAQECIIIIGYDDEEGDAHFYTGIGDFSYAIALLKEVGFPEELVLNTDPARFLASLKKR